MNSTVHLDSGGAKGLRVCRVLPVAELAQKWFLKGTC